MKNLQIRQPKLLIKSATYIFLLALLITSFSSLTVAQQSPQRGLYPTGTFQLSDVDIINTTSGNLTVRFPLGSLPPGRGDVRAGFSLYYNSKLFDSYLGGGTSSTGESYTADLLESSQQGGWRYGYEYKLQVYLRPNIGVYPPCSIEQKDIFRVVITYPDGNDHEFRPWGYSSGNSDGYYCIQPNGWAICGCIGQGTHLTNSMTYYSTDGTYTRLEVDASSGGDYSLLPWTMYLPNGGKITHLEPLPGGGVAYQRIYDRNNNWVEIKNVTLNSHPAVKIVDELNREVVLEYGGGGGDGSDTITSPAPNNQTVVWKVVRTSVDPVGGYNTLGSDGNTYSYDFPSSPGVSSIISPAQGGSLEYQFTYNINNGSGGELKDMILPTPGLTAKISYTFLYENTCQGCIPIASDALKSYVSQKQKSYVEEYDGVTSPPVIETWAYTRSGNINPLQSEVDTQAPDGGVTKEYSFCSSSGPCGPYNLQWRASLVYKIEHPDGSLTERLWQTNSPQNPYEAVFVNSYIKTEFTSIKEGGVLSKTAIKDYNYDKNGNVTKIVEYDWVSYSSIPRDADGRPTGIPDSASSQIKRVTANTYHVTTPDASDTTTANANVYHLTTAPKLRTAVKDKEVRSALASGTQSRSEYSYDNPLTTGNLTTERSWDSIKGAIGAPPLNESNSISVTHQYQTWPSGATGKHTGTTDANGNTTNYFYEDIGNGTTDLYVTRTETAANVAALKQTTAFKYDYNRGLVTETKDVDNNVSTLMTYDSFGRPVLVREAANTLAERQTATEYSDFDRRVIVRADLNTTGDGKLITIQHYDPWGRVCLTRRLESGDPAEATDKTKGVKIQTRYFAGGSNNSYELVSAPYRAATSGATGGEPGMAWKRTKFDNAGRVIEVETLIGATLPAPWGGNSVSSGKVTTEYDAEFATVTDQAGKKRRSRVDALGRLVRVDEPDAVGNLGGATAPVQPTSYTYNPLDNLIQTSQTGVPNGGSTPVTQNRYFNYSSLGRLSSANNPESGLISYDYDANGNLKTKTDARNIVINYTYDELNRIKTVDYSNTAVNPDITRVYDNPAPGAYGKGKFWKDYAGGDFSNGQNVEHKAVDGYDALGRPLSVRRQFKNNGVWGNEFTTSQTYDLAGRPKTKTYPSGRSVTYTYNVAGDLTDFAGNLGDGVSRAYSTAIQYNPQGQLTSEQFGTSMPLYHRRHYNSRGQLFDVRLGTDGAAVNDGPNPAQWTGASWNRGALRMFLSSNLIEYAWPAVAPQSNNGNLYRQDHFVPTALDGDGNVTAWAMSADYYCYDSLNRVAQTAEETYTDGGGYATNVFNQRFSYDRFGNRLVSSTIGTGVPNPGFKINGANNRLIAPTDVDGGQATDRMQYDASGNLIKDTHTQTGTSGNRTYDAENRMLTADGANGLANGYAYDADGQRTRRSLNNGGEVWWQVYGLGGELVAEYQLIGGTPTLKKEYGYRNGQMLVVWDGSETGDRQLQWLVQDHLGSTRMVVDRSGSLGGVRRHDFAPFGEELFVGVGIRSASIGYSGDSVRQKYTDKERDLETGLDYFGARYFASMQGRFTSADPMMASGRAGSPQSWNRYSYVLNNPLRFVDPEGFTEEETEEEKKRKAVVIIFGGGSATKGKFDIGPRTVSPGPPPAGLGEASLDDNESESIAQQIANDFPEAEIIQSGPGSSEVKEIAAGLIQNTSEYILIYGFSAGAKSAAKLTNALTDKGIFVDQVTTVDPEGFNILGGIIAYETHQSPMDTAGLLVPTKPKITNPEMVGDALNILGTNLATVAGARNAVGPNRRYNTTPYIHRSQDDIASPMVIGRIESRLSQIFNRPQGK